MTTTMTTTETLAREVEILRDNYRRELETLRDRVMQAIERFDDNGGRDRVSDHDAFNMAATCPELGVRRGQAGVRAGDRRLRRQGGQVILCKRCQGELTEANRRAGRCTQCGASRGAPFAPAPRPEPRCPDCGSRMERAHGTIVERGVARPAAWLQCAGCERCDEGAAR